MNPIRKATTAGTTKEYDFDLRVSKFLVKNFSGGDIIVRFGDDETQENGYLIPNDAWQNIPGADSADTHTKLYVTASETSAEGRGVEVEAVEYRLQRG